ncbi:Retrovirus-related Pol polyprotein from transposon RE1 [Senna tora]|uniref:Retrovirus-related Pol polyprotein from transposon RE1 n=1 Tax=Senna tora TaxID=362788 RepID=A0A834W7V0_9FABA|nr:Retrovirus-related Pol polyprotein from transposon RE1 [Senna tora]
MVGYAPNCKGYKLFDIENEEIFVSRDVHFYENVFPLKGSASSSNVTVPISPMYIDEDDDEVSKALIDVLPNDGVPVVSDSTEVPTVSDDVVPSVEIPVVSNTATPSPAQPEVALQRTLSIGNSTAKKRKRDAFEGSGGSWAIIAKSPSCWATTTMAKPTSTI